MSPCNSKFLNILVLLAALLITTPNLCPAASLNDLLGKQELDETERQETIEKIENIQDKLKLLQEKLRVLERRKAAEQAAQQATEASGVVPSAPVQVNWLPVDETTPNPGDFGLYTYLLFKGQLADSAAIGALEDFILTIETLPGNDIPANLANRFLVPVEKPQSLVSLGRQPYDFKLNEAYLQRLQIPDNLAEGPILVSMREPLDPYGSKVVPAFLAVSLGRQAPQKALALAKTWHAQDLDLTAGSDQPLSTLLWQLIDGAGPIRVVRTQQRTLVVLPQP